MPLGEMFMLVMSVFVIGLIVVPIAILIHDKVLGTHYACDFFGWHNGKGGTQSFDGCSYHAACSKCGIEVMQDSQGNWFAA